MLETNEPNDYEQYELQTVKWLEFLIKIALTKEHKQ